MTYQEKNMRYQELLQQRQQQANELLQRAIQTSGDKDWPIFTESLENTTPEALTIALIENNIHGFCLASTFPGFFKFLSDLTNPPEGLVFSPLFLSFSNSTAVNNLKAYGHWHIAYSGNISADEGRSIYGIYLTDSPKKS